jgi:hypothetical protein
VLEAVALRDIVGVDDEDAHGDDLRWRELGETEVRARVEEKSGARIQNALGRCRQ